MYRAYSKFGKGSEGPVMRITKAHYMYPKQGVYGLFKDGCLIWVGQTRNICNRLYAHISQEDRDFDEVWFHPMPYTPELEIDRVERALILRARPSENIRLPGGGSI